MPPMLYLPPFSRLFSCTLCAKLTPKRVSTLRKIWLNGESQRDIYEALEVLGKLALVRESGSQGNLCHTSHAARSTDRSLCPYAWMLSERYVSFNIQIPFVSKKSEVMLGCFGDSYG